MFFYSEQDENVIQDLYFNNVSFLLKMDTNFNDSSVNTAAATVYTGSPTISSAQSKFGGASGYFNGSSIMSYVNSNILYFNNNEDFTVEMWTYVNSPDPSGFGGFLCVNNPTDPALFNLCFYYSTTKILLQTPGGNLDFVSNTGLPLSQWVHLAITRQGASMKMFFNGNQVATRTYSGQIGRADDYIYVGSERSRTRKLNGYLDDLRITKGVARYTANFTPPDSLPTS